MGLVGPFPATLEIRTEEEGWLLLEALSEVKRRREHFYQDVEKARKFDKMYTRVLMACGDD